MSTSRQPKGIPVGGQFAAGAHSEAEVALARPTFVEYEAPIVGTAKLNLGSFDVLPEWPTGMPEPSVTYDFNDGKVNTYIDIDDSGSVRSMRFWTDDIDGTYDSTDHGETPGRNSTMKTRKLPAPTVSPSTNGSTPPRTAS